jgi:hypothetical protein
MLILVPFFMANYDIYHSFLSPYYMPQRVFHFKEFIEALAGNLVSPATGLFVFSPILLFSIYGILKRIKASELQLLDYFIIGAILAH